MNYRLFPVAIMISLLSFGCTESGNQIIDCDATPELCDEGGGGGGNQGGGGGGNQGGGGGGNQGGGGGGNEQQDPPKKECELRDGSKGKVFRFVDGDTFHFFATPGEECAEKRYFARIKGIDCPECTKANQGQNAAHYCIEDSNYDAKNHPHGLEAYHHANQLLPKYTPITVSCVMKGGECERDGTGSKRYLVIVNYEKDGKTYDFSVEMARAGMAFASTNFSSANLDAVCDASKEAFQKKAGVWSLGENFYDVIKQMTGKGWLTSGKQKRCVGVN